MRKTVYGNIILLVVFITAIGCKDREQSSKKSGDEELGPTAYSKKEGYRPNFHFTPNKGWMNDPNGMFYFDGNYHLYFQHYPDSTVWGPMHWGHAISKDMVTWKEMPIALFPDELGYIFSGSAVVDKDNTSGFGKEGKIPIIAIYTSHDPKKEKAQKIDVETQSIAYSLDNGTTWTKYGNNPVIHNPGARDFRDPKVSWNKESKRWTMVVAAGKEVMFYTSKDLRTWELASTFGDGVGSHGGVWECPDLFPLKVMGTEEEKWVLLVSINPGGPNGGSAAQYFVGDFDGTNFTLDKNFKDLLGQNEQFWVDYGRDNYAGVTWSNKTTSEGGVLHIGWMSNWMYANEVPTDSWRSATTIARELKLKKADGSYRLVASPVKELENYRGTSRTLDKVSVNGETNLFGSEEIDLARAEIRFEISDMDSKGFRFTLSNKNGDELVFGYDNKDKMFYINRTKSGKTNFSKRFADRISKAPRTSDDQHLNGTIFLDKTSIELFYDEGETVLTEIFFPNEPFETFSINSEDDAFVLDHIEAYNLNLNY